MKILLLYMSPNRTTEKISQALCSRFSQDGHMVNLINCGKQANRDPETIDPQVFEGVDLIGIGSPVFHMRILEPLENFLERALPRLQQPAKAFIYLTYGGITTGKAFLNTVKILQRHNIPVVGGMKVWAPHFFNHVPYPDPEALQTIDDFCSEMANQRFESLPWKKARRIFSYQTWRVKAVYPFTHLIGRKRELPIQIDLSRCMLCKRCVNECPTGAMELGETVIYNRQKCIFCYHCTTVCARHAIICPTEQVEEALKINKKVIGCEQPTNAIYL